MPMERQSLNHFSGCLLGGAVGDALGAPVEFMGLPEIRRRFGHYGITDYAPAYGRIGAITDDTQMALFTAEGLILNEIRRSAPDIPTSVYQAYLRWYCTQQAAPQVDLLARHGSCAVQDGILLGFKELHSRRAPGNTCLSALASGRMGTPAAPLNHSKGCGGVMRIAPIGLALPADAVFDTACEVAAITHGHPTGYLAAGCLAHILHRILAGDPLEAAVHAAMEVLVTKPEHRECLGALEAAMRLLTDRPVSFETVESLGGGWIAEEALAIGAYCALAAGDDFEAGIRLSVNHGGDSDSTGTVAGNILGALLGREAIPDRWLAELELFEVIEEVARDLHEQYGTPVGPTA